MAGFSGILQLTDLNDFIAPSQECIKPMLIEKSSVSRSKVHMESDGTYVELDNRGLKKKLAPAKITLNDCLACSGCVTSAETILIQQQSVEEFSNALKKKAYDPNFVIAVSVSPQSIASVAAKYDIPLQDASRKLYAWLKRQGVDYVFDTNFARNLGLLVAQNEFVVAYKANRAKNNDSHFCWITSACPGWICYAEKSYGDAIIPHISRVRSPQAIMGALVKDYLARKISRNPDNIYHLTVMPCFDKKLEASRDQFHVPGTSIKQVDCVISTAELDDMISRSETSLLDVEYEMWMIRPEESFLSLSGSSDRPFELVSHGGGGSGGYLEHIFRYAAKNLFNIEIKGPIELSEVKNKDFQEAVLTSGDQVLLRMAYCYGFRNIQNVVQKLRRQKCHYDYVEAMACPSGCLNGGGQIRAQSLDLSRSLLDSVSRKYDEASIVLPEENVNCRSVIEDWLHGRLDDTDAKNFLYTDYRIIEKSNIALSIKW